MLGVSADRLRPWKKIDHWTNSLNTASEKFFITYLNAYLPGLLVVEDKISMAHSLESRTPFLENDLLNLSLRLAPEVKLNNGRLKAIIKENAGSVLPETYLKQPKRGFPTPLRKWLRGDLRDFMENRLCGSDSYLKNIIDPRHTSEFVTKFNSSFTRKVRPLDEIYGHKMWQLISLESWIRTWSVKYGVELKLP
jgi:asparagine synthase (glutamine-hydrolysing)